MQTFYFDTTTNNAYNNKLSLYYDSCSWSVYWIVCSQSKHIMAPLVWWKMCYCYNTAEHFFLLKPCPATRYARPCADGTDPDPPWGLSGSAPTVPRTFPRDKNSIRIFFYSSCLNKQKKIEKVLCEGKVVCISSLFLKGIVPQIFDVWNGKKCKCAPVQNDLWILKLKLHQILIIDLTEKPSIKSFIFCQLFL